MAFPFRRLPAVAILSLAGLLGALLRMSAAEMVLLPRTEGKTLADQRVVVANAVKGKATLLIITFTRSAGEKAREWRNALRQKGLPTPNYTLYQIAELEDVPRIIRWSVISGMRRGIPTDEYSTFMVLTTDTEQWKKFVAFKNEDDPYLVILDASGNVKARIAGDKTDATLDQLTQALK